MGSARTQSGRIGRLAPVVATLALVAAGLPALLGVPVAAAAAGGLTGISVRDAKNGAVVGEFRFLLTRDQSGDPRDSTGCAAPDAGYPASCAWPSLHEMRGGTLGTDGQSDVIAQGDQDYFAGGVTVPLTPNTHYLVSATAPDHKIDGVHFISDGAGNAGTVTVTAQPFSALKLATLRAQVFDDVASTNGEFDIPDEQPDGTVEKPWMSGFQVHLSDVLGEVTTDWYGNPLCTSYAAASADGSKKSPIVAASWGTLDNGFRVDKVWLDAADRPDVVQAGGKCMSDRYGDIAVPYLGPNRYGVSVGKPTGSDWVQTSTLEGGHDWDTWVQEGATGFDTEKVLNGEPVPQTQLGFVHGGASAPSLPAGGTGTITGRAWSIKAYWPPVGGSPFADGAGGRLDAPVNRVWLALSDLGQGDTTTYVGRGNSDGSFTIPKVPAGDYSLALWDDDQNLILDLEQLTVKNGKVSDLGVVGLYHWFAEFSGSVFLDANENGKRDSSEAGVGGFTIGYENRDNSVEDQGKNFSVTDATGHWDLKQAYPLGKWMVVEAFDTRLRSTGYTYQADNAPTEKTVKTSNVDVSVLPLIGLAGRIDFGVQRYAPNENGGIVGSVVYDSTRNELNARYEATEDYEAAISGMTVHLNAPVPCTPATYDGSSDASTCTGATSSPQGGYVLDSDGAYRKGAELTDAYTTEQWHQPTGCTAYDVNKKPVMLPWMPTGPNARCIESPDLGTQIADETVDADGNQASPGQEVNGNYGFTTVKDSAGNDVPMPPGDYLVSVESPTAADRTPIYKVTREEDINVFTGDHYTPQVPEPPCAGAKHIVTVTDPDFLGAGGSPYEGQPMPLCDTKLVKVTNGVSVAPSLNRPGFGGGSEPTGRWGSASTEEVSERAA